MSEGGAIMDKKRCEIEKVAYELYERSGFVCGNDLEHWFEAEKIICVRSEPAAKPKKVAVKKVASESSRKTRTAKTEKKATTVVKKTSGRSGTGGRTKKISPEDRPSL
jgi:hypothetical protein